MQKFIVGFYEIDRAYGGPEDGGWWYDTGTLVRLHALFPTEQAAIRAAARAKHLLDLIQRGNRSVGSVLYAGGRYRARVFAGQAPAHSPQERPRYE